MQDRIKACLPWRDVAPLLCVCGSVRTSSIVTGKRAPLSHLRCGTISQNIDHLLSLYCTGNKILQVWCCNYEVRDPNHRPPVSAAATPTQPARRRRRQRIVGMSPAPHAVLIHHALALRFQVITGGVTCFCLISLAKQKVFLPIALCVGQKRVFLLAYDQRTKSR